jgi:acyl carrier protein
MDRGSSQPEAQSPPDAGLAQRLERAHPRHRRLILSQWLTQALADLVGAEDTAAIGARRGFAELGVDSLMATRILDRVRDALNLELPVTTIFNYPTVPELAEHLLQRWWKDPELAASVEGRPVPEDGPTHGEIAARIGAGFASTQTEESDVQRP